MVANQNEGNPQATGQAQVPTSPASSPESQPLPDYVQALQSRLDQHETLIKGVQKGTDKQIGQVRGDIKRILELREQGLNETQIQRELFIDQMMTPASQEAPVQKPAGSGQQNTGLDIEPILKSLQFPDNDPALAALRIKYANDPNGLLRGAAELRLAQATSLNPSPGTSLSQSGVITGAAAELDQVYAEYEQAFKNPTANAAKLEHLAKRMKELGG